MSTRNYEGWWRKFFTLSNYPLGELTRGRHAQAEVRELLRRLPVQEGASILDVGCGLGRHSFELARKGYRVTGVDYSASYLAQARRKAGGRRRSPRFLRRDMRRLGFRGRFDAAINLWTSFGYFPKLSDDLKALRSIRDALRPGGWLAMDLVDGERFMGDCAPKRTWSREGSYWCLEDLDLRRGTDPAILSEKIFIAANGKTTRGKTFVRLYTRRRLASALRRSGFSKTYFFEGLLGGQHRASRLFALTRRN